MSEEMQIETRIAMEDNALKIGVTKLGQFSPYTCPECHGALLQLKTGACCASAATRGTPTR